MFMKLWRRIKKWWNKRPIDREISDDYHQPVGHPTAYKVWYPKAEKINETEDIWMKTRYEFEDGYPEGLVVHWPSGWMLPKGVFSSVFPLINPLRILYNMSGKGIYAGKESERIARKYAIQTAQGAEDRGHCYLVMDVFGKIYQSRPINKGGYHAGKSYWKGIGYNVSRKLIGIEIENPGSLKKKGDKYLTWFGQEIPERLVRLDEKGRPYCMYTADQESALETFCIWLYNNSPKKNKEKILKIKNIVGHDEVAPNRKDDPGASLSMTMENFRKMLTGEEYETRNGKKNNRLL